MNVADDFRPESSLLTTKGTKVELPRKPLNLHLWVVSEVHDEAKPEAGGFEVIQHLSLMFGCDGFDRFQFEDDLVVTDNVGLVGLIQEHSLIR